MSSLKETLVQALRGYTGKAFNGESYLTTSEDGQRFVVISISTANGKRIVNAGLVVQIANDLIIIDKDINNKMLVNALLQAGIARDQIILAYAGESIPQKA